MGGPGEGGRGPARHLGTHARERERERTRERRGRRSPGAAAGVSVWCARPPSGLHSLASAAGDQRRLARQAMGRAEKKASTSAREAGARAATVFHLTLAQCVLDMALRLLAQQRPTPATVAVANKVHPRIGLADLLESEGVATERLLAHLRGADCMRLAASCRSARHAVAGSREAALRVQRCLAERALGEHAWAFDAFLIARWDPSIARHLRPARTALRPLRATPCWSR